MPEPAAMGGRRAAWLVARREIVERGRERSFLISTVVSVAVLLAIVLLPTALGLGGDTARTLAVAGVPAETTRALEERSSAFGIDLTIEEAGSPADARALVRADDADAALVGTAELAAPQEPDDDLAVLVQTVVRERATIAALARRGATEAEIAATLDPSPVQLRALEPDGDEEGAATVAFLVVLVLYFQLIGYGYWVASGVVEEKSSRVAELLLATLRPSHLLAGKIGGIGVLAIAQLLGMAAIGIGAAVLTGAADLPPATGTAILVVFPWFIAGYLFYAALFALAAALVARQEQLQSATTPLNLVLIAAFFVSFSVQEDPEGGVARIASLLPPCAPLLMPPRIVRDAAPWWEIALSAGLLAAAIAAVVPLAGRIYAGGLLRTGSRSSLRAAWASARD